MTDYMKCLREGIPFFWENPLCCPGSWSLPFGMAEIYEAEARLCRFAPLLAELFDEAAESHGIIESQLLDVPRLSAAIASVGRVLLKADHDLPVAGSVKARGGIYEVLCFAERLAIEHGLLRTEDNYRRLASAEARALFGKYTVSVGSTGNLGLSIGTMAAALGFRAEVHMSCEAKAWKKEMLRSRGAVVIEHEGDYSAAVAEGRRIAAESPFAYFVDDENSKTLFIGYAVAALRIQAQLKVRGIQPDASHPLFVYLPCGVGGAPGGICFGLKQVFGDAVHCFFAEPVASPCMTLGLISRKFSDISVYEIGLDNKTNADGLAVPRPSGFVGQVVEPLVNGCFTVRDDELERCRRLARDLEGLKIECSAAAGFPGPGMVLESDYCEKRGLSRENIIHILWTTGGRYLPDE